ncbi:molybdenum cofactor biosynthesis protein (moeB) [Archaeoglobus fulgidus DSM 4304]|uniref:Molybdenum cofactor biosynthesis protein (MoeB) n=3 Tax=Archaeoglobus fulgidus TaxID=2234 RepID=O29719_ARCFU|nr:molybdenum cofactor biosynthesis protein (moeB) [Archaeoglobus fulgidus DSM 4304]
MIFGEEGQRRLSKAKVLVVGAGGLGSPVIAYLAAAGVGKIGIVDGDTVEVSNLQRQIIHAGNLGENKAESAAEFVKKLNPDVEVDVYPFSITPENVLEVVERYDVVAGCPDSFRSRFLLNDACMILKKTFVHAAVYAWEGEVATFTGKPCYRCYIPKSPEESGRAILGATAGAFGCLQAAEVIKIITGSGEPLIGRLIRGNLAEMEFFTINIPERDDCPVCSGRLKGIFDENYVDDCTIRRLE